MVARLDGSRGRGVVFDGMASSEVALALLETFRRGRAVDGARGTLTAETSSALPEMYDALEDPPSVHPLSAEQSNTSVRFDTQLILKLIRHVEPGVHPEIEISRHLTERVEFERSPRFAGALHYVPAAARGAAAPAEPAALATLQEFVWSQTDGWTYTVDEVRLFLEEEGATPFDEIAEDARPDPIYAESARVLGVRTAELHLALADARGDVAFAPERFARADADAVLDRVRRRLRHLAPALRRMARAETPGAQQAHAILDAMPQVAAWLAPAVAAAEGLVKIRCHGDYHLGQLLWGRGDFTIVDFEGEVGLPLAERREKACVFIDVAGMLRSFQYAALFALRAHVATLPDATSVLERDRPWARWWERRATERFLDGYFETASGAAFVPAEPDVRHGLLSLYLLDKALHELEYELDHRPDWVAIPLQGVAAILQSLEGEAP